jgi:outer membrane protein assembly factor BamD
MTKKLHNILLIAIALAIFTGCASKQENEEYNKPAIHWYNKILKQIYMGQLDLADDTFTSLESEHRNSPLISSSMMILVDAHIDNEEYEMANYYLDEYIKRYAFNKDIDYIRYLKIKSKFMSFKSQYREQQLILDILEEIKDFKTQYPNSPYIYLVDTMNTRVLMAKASFDKEISNLYTRIDKPVASKVYNTRAKESFSHPEDIQKVKTVWYKSIFENGISLWN